MYGNICMKSDQGWVKWSWGRCWKMASLSLHPHLSLEKAPGHHHDDHHGHGHHGHHHHHGHGHHLHPPLSHISILIIACSAVAAWSGSEKSTLFIIPGLSNLVYLDYDTWIIKPGIPRLSYLYCQT